MKRFFLALIGGAAACSVIATATTVGFGFGSFDVTLLINGFIIGLVVALLGLIATYVCRRSPAQVPFHSVATMLATAVVAEVVVAVKGGGFDALALLAICVYGFVTGLVGGFCASLAAGKPLAKSSPKLYALPVVLFASLSVLAWQYPARLPAPTENVQRVNESNFETEVLSSDIPVVVDFSAGYCGPCRALAPKIEKLAAKLKGKVKFVTVDVEESPKLKEEYNVDSLPMLMRFQNGEMNAFLVGNRPYEDLELFFTTP